MDFFYSGGEYCVVYIGRIDWIEFYYVKYELGGEGVGIIVVGNVVGCIGVMFVNDV